MQARLLAPWCIFCALLVLLMAWAKQSPSTTLSGIQEGFDAPRQRIDLPEPAGVLVINLQRRADRMTHFRHSFSWTDMARTLPLHRVAAVDGNGVDASKVLSEGAMKDMQEFLRTKQRKVHSELTPGGIGCYLSHIKCWEFVAQQSKPWLVCEDDAILPQNIGQRLREALAKVPSLRPETVIFLHILCDPRLYRELRCDSLGDNVYRAHSFWSTACYYVTPEAARTMLQKALPMSIQVDHVMAQWGREGVVDNYAYPVVRTADRDTDIQAPLRTDAA